MAKPGPYALRGVIAILLVVSFGVIVSRSRSDARRPSFVTEAAGTFNSEAVVSNVTYRSTSKAFRGGDATAVMGAVEVDLRDALMEGDQARIEAGVVMGRVTIRIPSNWIVESKLTTVAGKFENRTSTSQQEGAKRLILEGDVVMGKLEIEN